MVNGKKQWKEMSTGEKGGTIGCTFIFIIVAFVLFGAFGSSKNNDAKPKTCNDYSSNAVVMAPKFVEDHLQYVGSSVFPSYFESPGVVQCTDKRFTYGNWVDAANGFGAKQRLYYSITLEFLGGEWTRKSSWKEVSFIFFDK